MGEHRDGFHGSQNTAYQWVNIGVIFMEVKTQLTVGEHMGGFHGSQNTTYQWENMSVVFMEVEIQLTSGGT